ncbi:MAG: hypothetical protein JW737_06570, partial [Acidobacteria bacterium]|nr:hypothetical protein [Acidobacteriota bacterium]
TPLRIVVKHYNENGEEVWVENKLVVDLSYSADTGQLRITTLNNGDVMVCWKNDFSTIYGIRCDSNGNLITGWPSSGKAIAESGVKINGVRMEGDGSGGVYIAWLDDQNKRISVTHIDQNGNTSVGWSIEGKLVSSANGTAGDFEIAASSDGSLYIAWQEMRGTTEDSIYLQRLNPDSTISSGWNSGGMLVAPLSVSEDQIQPQLTVDEADGVYIIWKDYRDSYANLYAQRVDKDGVVNPSWSLNGTPFCLAWNFQHEHRLINTERGGIIVTWSDYRNNVAYDIYAQRICPSSALGNCANDNILPKPVIESNCKGCSVPFNITFDGSASTDPDGTIEEYEWIIGNESWHTVSFTKSFTVSPQRFYTTGDVTLWVRDNTGDWSKTVSPYYIFPTDTISLEFKLHPNLIKARGKGTLYMKAAVLTNAVPPLGQWDPFLFDLGLKFTVDNGTLSGDSLFEDFSGYYYQDVISGTEGTARLCCYLCGLDEFCLTATYYWPQPPVNIVAEARLERSLFLARFYSTVNWEANPAQVYSPLNYNIYRCYDSGEMILAGVVPVTQFTFSEIYYGRPASSYAVTSIDYDGDESDPAYVDIMIVDQ